MARLEKWLKIMMLVVGSLGVIVIYSGFLYLSYQGSSEFNVPWYILLSPWLCIYFGLSSYQQVAVLGWFKRKVTR